MEMKKSAIVERLDISTKRLEANMKDMQEHIQKTNLAINLIFQWQTELQRALGIEARDDEKNSPYEM